MSFRGIESEHLPGFAKQLNKETAFTFDCHKQSPCFTECCRLLDLPLTPYDILRLRRATGLSSTDFIEKYVIIEQEDGEVLPRLFLTMVDDGRGSCAFVSPNGCAVYHHRPGACRAYPVGRAVQRLAGGKIDERFVLLHEDHCQGFQETSVHTAAQYCLEQGLTDYNYYNDPLTSITQHDNLQKEGFRLSTEERELLFLSLFDLDAWREKLGQGAITLMSREEALNLSQGTDEELLLTTITWLSKRLFTCNDR